MCCCRCFYLVLASFFSIASLQTRLLGVPDHALLLDAPHAALLAAICLEHPTRHAAARPPLHFPGARGRAQRR